MRNHFFINLVRNCGCDVLTHFNKKQHKTAGLRYLIYKRRATTRSIGLFRELPNQK